MDMNGQVFAPLVFVSDDMVTTAFAVLPTCAGPDDLARVRMTPAEAREYAARLVAMADKVEK